MLEQLLSNFMRANGARIEFSFVYEEAVASERCRCIFLTSILYPNFSKI